MQTMLRPEYACATVPLSAYTAAGFRSWMDSPEFPSSGRIELYGNQVCVDMSPEHESRHARLKGEIFLALSGLVHEYDLGEIRPDGVTFTDADQDLVTQPDAMFFTWDSYRSGRVWGGEQGFVSIGSSTLAAIKSFLKSTSSKTAATARVRSSTASLPPQYSVGTSACSVCAIRSVVGATNSESVTELPPVREANNLIADARQILTLLSP